MSTGLNRSIDRDYAYYLWSPLPPSQRSDFLMRDPPWFNIPRSNVLTHFLPILMTILGSIERSLAFTVYHPPPSSWFLERISVIHGGLPSFFIRILLTAPCYAARRSRLQKYGYPFSSPSLFNINTLVAFSQRGLDCRISLSVSAIGVLLVAACLEFLSARVCIH